VIGNPEMQDSGWALHIKSLAGALPIMLGDPRKLSTEDFTKYRGYADWLQEMETHYQIMSYRQDLVGFGEPMEGYWDGFQRINTDTKAGGIIGVFRQGAIESKRVVTIHGLDAEKKYQVKTLDGKIITTQTGNNLNSVGFEVHLDQQYDGDLFEVMIEK
jgi:alpha-galactosidase